jgi:glutathione S-transferase
MKLVGMLDSPYVRRTAIAFECLGVPFEHEAVSVFSTFEKFQSINPVVKAPTLLCDDGEVLMDSSLILQYVEATRTAGRSLWPRDPVELQHDVRAVGLALAACEKSVLAAYAGLEQEISRRPTAFAGFGHAGIAAAVAWQFTQSELAAMVAAREHPALVALSARLEATPEFTRYPPVGPGVPSG